MSILFLLNNNKLYLIKNEKLKNDGSRKKNKKNLHTFYEELTFTKNT